MEALPAKVIILSYNKNIAKRQTKKNLSFNFLSQLSNRKSVKLGYKRSVSPLHSKKYYFQDFQGFVQPLHLLPVSKAKIFSEAGLEEVVTKLEAESHLYVLKLYTSNQYGSDLRDLHAAILLCLIDTNKTSVLQRISAVFTKEHQHIKEINDDQMHFRSGSDETILFRGPKLEKIEAIWVGLESGSWRLGGIRLIVFSTEKSSVIAEQGSNFYTGVKYDFQVDDLLIGEGGDVSIAELRPEVVTDLPRLSLSNVISTVSIPLASISKESISNEEGMKQYSDLKLSLLIYDAVLLSIGTVILDVGASEELAYAFLFGGLSGFVYLLLLQKSVDTLSASALPSTNTTGNLVEIFKGFRGPLLTTVLLLATIAGLVKYGVGTSSIQLTPEELLVGFIGFLTCKAAVVLSAFKPLGSSRRES